MFLTKEWIEEAFPDDHVLTTHRKDDMLSDTRIKSVILDSRQLLDRLYTTYDFDRIVYFSEYLLPHNNPEGELDRLRRVLQEFREKEVELIYFSGPESVLTPPTSQSILTRTAEELCLHYAKQARSRSRFSGFPTSTAFRQLGRNALSGFSSRSPPKMFRLTSKPRSLFTHSVLTNWPAL